MLIYEGNLHTQKNGAISQLGARKLRFPLNMVDIRTDRRTDFYRVALLLKRFILNISKRSLIEGEGYGHASKNT